MKPFGPPNSTLRSPDYTTRIRGKQLSDKVIEKYILAGRYGPERRDALLATRAKKKRPKSSWSRVKKLLDL